jgi:hypothetical protein
VTAICEHGIRVGVFCHLCGRAATTAEAQAIRAEHRDRCIYQIVDVCNKQCKPAELCKGYVPVLRSQYRGDGGHHHLSQFTEVEDVAL